MSAPAQVTEAHRELACTLTGRHYSISEAAELIADSEARVVAAAVVTLEARITSDEELFHDIRLKLTAACGDPYKLHDEALDAIIAERDQLRAEAQQAHITRDATCIKLKLAGACIKLAGELREARAEVEKANGYINLQVARAERAEAEVKRLGHLEAVLRSSAADMTAGSITAGGVAGLRAEVERLKSDGAASVFVNMSCRASRAETERNNLRADLDAIKAILTEEKDRAERAEAELATERAKVRTLRTACESICEEWGKSHDTPFYAGNKMEALASKALEKLEDEA